VLALAIAPRHDTMRQTGSRQRKRCLRLSRKRCTFPRCAARSASERTMINRDYIHSKPAVVTVHAVPRTTGRRHEQQLDLAFINVTHLNDRDRAARPFMRTVCANRTR
jgi:hypothetical protein